MGAILGGGGNARYLMDYPAAAAQPDPGLPVQAGLRGIAAAPQAGDRGDANSSDGCRAEHRAHPGHVNCNAGYELSIASRALALNPRLRLYGLQWTAPGLVDRHGGRGSPPATSSYLLGWLGCARRRGLTISYLGGWNESDNGTHHRGSAGCGRR